MISSACIDSGSEALPGMVFWRSAANSASLKSPEILTGVDIGAFQRSDTSFNTSQIDSGSAPS